MIGAVLLPIGLFWFTSSTYPQVHWFVSILGGAFFGFGQVLLYISLINYVVDACPVSSRALETMTPMPRRFSNRDS